MGPSSPLVESPSYDRSDGLEHVSLTFMVAVHTIPEGAVVTPARPDVGEVNNTEHPRLVTIEQLQEVPWLCRAAPGSLRPLDPVLLNDVRQIQQHLQRYGPTSPRARPG